MKISRVERIHQERTPPGFGAKHVGFSVTHMLLRRSAPPGFGAIIALTLRREPAPSETCAAKVTPPGFGANPTRVRRNFERNTRTLKGENHDSDLLVIKTRIVYHTDKCGIGPWGMQENQIEGGPGSLQNLVKYLYHGLGY